jgi:multidrug efflux pump subunit AcrA (membrane-fusion protein)
MTPKLIGNPKLTRQYCTMTRQTHEYSTPPGWRKQRGFSLALVALLSALLAGCSKSEARSDAAAADPVAVTVVPVAVGPAQRSIDVIGTLYGDEEATVSAKVAGRVVAIHHDIGDRVARGAPLAQLDTTDYALAKSQKEAALGQSLAKLGLTELPDQCFDPESVPTVQRAKLEAANAESKYTRGKQLHDQNPPRLSDQEFADLQTAWEVARSNYNLEVLTARSTLAEARTRAAELAQAEQMLADATIRAPGAVAASSTSSPTTGAAAVPLTPTEFVVAQRSASLGEYVREGSAMFRLIDDDPLKLRAAVPERFLAEVSAGQSVRVTVEAYRDAFAGKVTRINPQVDPASRNFTVEIVVPNEKNLLRAGGFARAQIQTRTDGNVLFVPVSSVVSFAGVNRVYLVEDDKAVERPVELGDRAGELVEVRAGLKPGDRVVIAGAGKLAGGTPVQATAATQPTTTSGTTGGS